MLPPTRNRVGLAWFPDYVPPKRGATAWLKRKLRGGVKG
jgi:hypothetical protein